jgi:hypothetical protein
VPDQSPKRGATPSPRSALAAAVPYAPLIGAPPNLIMKPKQISMWGNDVHGDCVTAEEAFAKACNNPEIFIPDAEVISWATSHGVLEGAYLTQVMNFMQNNGFAEGSFIYDDGPFLSVNWTDAGTLQSAISRGPVKIGVAADQIENAWNTTGGQSGWFATGFHADANEDHCVSLCGYGSMSWLAQELGVQVPAGVDGTHPGYAMFTWDSIGIIDVPSMTGPPRQFRRHFLADMINLPGFPGVRSSFPRIPRAESIRRQSAAFPGYTRPPIPGSQA